MYSQKGFSLVELLIAIAVLSMVIAGSLMAFQVLQQNTASNTLYTNIGQKADFVLRKMEREAYTKGNLIFRDYEDLIKTGKINIEIDFSNSGEPKMSLKEWKNNEINTKLMQKWGLLKEAKEVTTEDTEELDYQLFVVFKDITGP